MKEILLILCIILSTNVFGQLYVNKGPIFFPEKLQIAGTLTQDQGVISLYSLWNGVHELKNNIKKRWVTSQFNKTNKIQSLSPLDLEKNFLAFGYSYDYGNNYTWGFVGTKYGYCHGMALVLRQFLYFASFDPNEQKESDDLSFYKRKVDQLMRGENVTFKGFANLAQFSRTNIARYIKKHIVDQWGLNTTRYLMYKDVYYKNAKALVASDIKKLKQQIVYYLSRQFYPRIIVAERVKKNPHVVFVTNIYESTNRECIRIKYFSVGSVDGGYFVTKDYCPGNFAYMPKDEKYYFMNTILKSATVF